MNAINIVIIIIIISSLLFIPIFIYVLSWLTKLKLEDSESQEIDLIIPKIPSGSVEQRDLERRLRALQGKN